MSRSLRPPTKHRDGFHEVSDAPANWTDLTSQHQFQDITYKVWRLPSPEGLPRLVA
jgi:hypothetical protein